VKRSAGRLDDSITLSVHERSMLKHSHGVVKSFEYMGFRASDEAVMDW
jgi:hypothetical protein